MDHLHSLLKRQLKRHINPANSFSKECQDFIETINRAYLEFDSDRGMLERSLDLSSQELLQTNSEMRAIFQAFPDLFLRLDLEGTILDYKSDMGSDLFFNPEEMRGKQIQNLPLVNGKNPFDRAIRQFKKTKSMVSIEYSCLASEMESFYEARLVPLGENQIIVIIRNITGRKDAEKQIKKLNEKLEHRVLERTRELKLANQNLENENAERKRAEEKIRHQAYYDTLTDLPNRFLLREHLQQALLIAKRENKPVSLLMMNIDRFREINNTLGHQNGDLILQEVVLRIRKALRESDTFARMEGDKFSVLLPSANIQGATLAARNIQKALKRPFILEGLALDVNMSIGIAVYPEHGEETNLLIQRADIAMFLAKQTDSKYFIYAADKDKFQPQRLVLMGELRQAIESNQLVLHYQPKIDFRTRHLVGVEALVRWQHPRRGMIPPDQFIMLAEQTGLIKPLTLWVLNTALRQCRVWRQAGIEISVAVNLSARNLIDPKLPDQIAERLYSCALTTHSLELEITESAIMLDPAGAMEILTRLNQTGIRLSIDDFGTGYSSLSYLKKLPVDVIKIDKSFVMNMAADHDDAMIVRSTIDLTHNLGHKVVAEGVESQEIWDKLSALGCDIAQGYYMSHPLPEADLARWMAESPWGLKRKSDIRKITI